MSTTTCPRCHCRINVTLHASRGDDRSTRNSNNSNNNRRRRHHRYKPYKRRRSPPRREVEDEPLRAIDFGDVYEDDGLSKILRDYRSDDDGAAEEQHEAEHHADHAEHHADGTREAASQ